MLIATFFDSHLMLNMYFNVNVAEIYVLETWSIHIKENDTGHMEDTWHVVVCL